MTIIRNYPVFEDNQILTSSQLNDLAEYLDQQNRLTRAKLIGIGIVCGLEVSCTEVPELIISKGVGITSEGFLVTLKKSVFTQTRIYHHRPFDYEAFQDVPDGAFYELLPAGFTPDDNSTNNLPFLLDKGFLEDKVVLLFLECFDNDLASCLGKSCDELGIDRILTVRPLVIDRAEAQKIWTNCETGRSTASFDRIPRLKPKAISIVGTPRATPTPFVPLPSPPDKSDLKNIYMPRVLFDPAALHSRDYIDFAENYTAAVETTFDPLCDLLETAYEVFSPILQSVYPSNPLLDTDIQQLKTRWKQYFQNRKNSRWAYIGIQYFYDFLKDLILAYNAFRDLACEILAACCVDTCKAPHYFPKHLILGLAVTSGDICDKPIFRTGFWPAPIYNGQQKIKAEAEWMFQRIVSMLRNFNLERIGLLSNEQPAVKATPSCEKKSPLSLRSIPYYYRFNTLSPLTSANLSEIEYFWDADLNRICSDEARILAYEHQLIDLTPIDRFTHPLNFDLDPFDFFRIEGHLGKNISIVLEELNDLRQSKDLPFDLKAVFLNGNAALTEMPDCFCSDLQPQYATWRNRRLALLSNLLRWSVALEKALMAQKEIGDVVNNYGFGIAEETDDSNAADDSGAAAKNQAAFTRQKTEATETTGNQNLGKKMNEALKTKKGPAIAVDFQQLNYEIADAQQVALETNSSDNLTAEQKAIIEQLQSFNEALRQLIGALPLDLKEFELETVWLPKYKRLLEVNLDTMERIAGFPLFNEDRDTFTAYLVIYCFVHGILTSLGRRPYANIRTVWDTLQFRKNAWQESHRFSEFIKKHPGAKHQAGVKPGGTFILVYLGADYPFYSFQPVGDGQVPGSYAEYQDYPISGVENIAVQAGKQQKIPAFVSTQLFQAAPAPSIPRGTVIADFSLPYRCCDECGDTPNAVIPLQPIALPRCGVALLQTQREGGVVSDFFYRDIQLQLLDNRFSPADFKPFFKAHSSPDQIILPTQFGTAHLQVNRPWEPDPSLSKRILTYRVDLNKIYPIPGDSPDVISQKQLLLANKNILTDTFHYQYYDIKSGQKKDSSTVTIFIPLFKGDVEVPTTELIVNVELANDGTPIKGAAIAIDGVTKGTTDAGGSFSGQYPLGEYSLTATKAGFQNQNSKVNINRLDKVFVETLKMKRRISIVDIGSVAEAVGYVKGSAESIALEQAYTLQVEQQQNKVSKYQDTALADDLVLKQTENAVEKFNAGEPLSQEALTRDFTENEAALLHRMYKATPEEQTVYAASYDALISSYLTRSFTNSPKAAPASMKETLAKSMAEAQYLGDFETKTVISDWVAGMDAHLPDDFKAPIQEILQEEAPKGSLRGKLIDKASGAPIAKAGLSLEGTDWTVESDSAGQFILPDLPIGDYTVEVTAEGYLPVSRPVTIKEKETQVITFELEALSREGSLSGRIVSAVDQSPIPGARIKVRDTESSTTSGEDGNYAFDKLSERNWMVSVQAEGYHPAEQVVAIVTGGEQTADFALEPIQREGRLEGRVITGGDRPVPEARVEINDTDLKSNTDSEGKYAIDDIPVGEYKIVITAEGFEPNSAKTKIGNGVTTELYVNLRKVKEEAGLKGKISEAGKKGIAAVKITLESQEVKEQAYENVTDEKGRYQFTKIPAGEYRLKAEAKGYISLTRKIKLLAGEAQSLNIVLVPEKRIITPPGKRNRASITDILNTQRDRLVQLKKRTRTQDELFLETTQLLKILSEDKPIEAEVMNPLYRKTKNKLVKALSQPKNKATESMHKKAFTELNYAYLNQLVQSHDSLDADTKKTLQEMTSAAKSIKSYSFGYYVNRWKKTMEGVGASNLVERIVEVLKG